MLIGEQATGKSTVAKVLAVCRNLSYITYTDMATSPFYEGLRDWGLLNFWQEDTFIFYECKHYSLSPLLVTMFPVKPTFNELGISNPRIPLFNVQLKPISPEFKNLLLELEKIKLENSDQYGGWAAPTSFFKNDVARVLDIPYYFPAERGLQSIFTLGPGSIRNMDSFLLNYFSEVDMILKNYSIETIIKPLGINYKNIDGIGYVGKNAERGFSNISNAASGYQSTIPIVLVTKYFNEIRNYNEVQKKEKTFIIEEPELNLYPIAQYELMKYLIGNANVYKNHLLIATHSPYILASINNLLLAGKYGGVQINEVIDKKYWIDIDDVSAYMLLPNGECEDILDKDAGQIKAEKIDSASVMIAEQYEKIMDLAFSKI